MASGWATAHRKPVCAVARKGATDLGWATAHRKPVCAVARKGATAFRGTKWPRQVAPFRVLALPAYARGGARVARSL